MGRTTNPAKATYLQICHSDRSVPGFPATRLSLTAACAVFIKESRMKFADSTDIHRKSGVAKWRDLLCAPTPNNPPAKATYARFVIPSGPEGSVAVRPSPRTPPNKSTMSGIHLLEISWV